MSAGRAELVAAHVDLLRSCVRHVPGAGTLLAPSVLQELVGLVTFVETELGKGSKRTTPRVEALQRVLDEGLRVAAMTRARIPLAELIFGEDMDTTTAAELLGMKIDTLRFRIRTGGIRATKVNGRHRIPWDAIVEYQQKEAA
jgi:excisionase family DNA binding protein